MRVFTRIAAVLVVVAAPAFGWLHGSVEAPPSARRVSLEEIRARGELRLATRRGTLSYFIHEGVRSGFEYELIEAFAEKLGVRLAPRIADSGPVAEGWLREGIVDVAILVPERTRPPGLLAIAGEVARDGSRFAPPTGDLYVHESAPSLRAMLDQWIEEAFADGPGVEIYARYFGVPGRLAHGPKDPHRARALLPAYERLIARHARAAGYDERLIAALIFQESSFDASAVSPKGAVGLMQVLPVVGRELGIARLHEPDANVRAGVRYLQRLSERFSSSHGEDHLAFVLSAYLLGPGHVEDAQAIARSVGLDPDRWWGSVEEVLPLLEDPRFYGTARHGYAKGRHAVEYVYRIFRLGYHFRGPDRTSKSRLASRSRTLPAG